jgi:hypothetical protein
MDNLVIDNEAKLKIELKKIPRDANGQPYYIGKLQFPGTLDFEEGVSFMVFTSEEGFEEIQMAPLDPQRRSKGRRGGLGLKGGRLCIDLHPVQDQNGRVFYVGEAIGPTITKLRNGIFFSVFISRENAEELQISRLAPRPRKEFNNYDNKYREEDSNTYNNAPPAEMSRQRRSWQQDDDSAS